MNTLRQASIRSFRSISINKTGTVNTTQNRFGHTVRVILTSDLPEGRGYAGEVQKVKAGYARNFLIPLKKALYATPTNFKRAGIPDPDLILETVAERKARESEESDEDLKAADFLRYYLRNKTLTIWRNVDINSSMGGGAGTPIHPGVVNQKHVREKFAKQLKIDLEDFEKVQIYPELVSHSELDEEGTTDDVLAKMEPLKEGEECKVELKTVGEYLVKIHLKGDYSVPLRLAVVKR